MRQGLEVMLAQGDGSFHSTCYPGLLPFRSSYIGCRTCRVETGSNSLGRSLLQSHLHFAKLTRHPGLLPPSLSHRYDIISVAYLVARAWARRQGGTPQCVGRHWQVLPAPLPQQSGSPRSAGAASRHGDTSSILGTCSKGATHSNMSLRQPLCCGRCRWSQISRRSNVVSESQKGGVAFKKCVCCAT
eukprot:1143942-Pelagomonas_calceolata.AAC.10